MTWAGFGSKVTTSNGSTSSRAAPAAMPKQVLMTKMNAIERADRNHMGARGASSNEQIRGVCHRTTLLHWYDLDGPHSVGLAIDRPNPKPTAVTSYARIVSRGITLARGLDWSSHDTS